MLTGAARRLYEQVKERERNAPRGPQGQGARPVVLRIPRPLRRLRVVQAERRDPDRPRTRGDCENGPRPCPYVSCRHHLYLDVKRGTGTIILNRPDVEPDELDHSCALDVAEGGPIPLERIAEMLGMTRERVRQIEDEATRKLSRKRSLKVLLGDE